MDVHSFPTRRSSDLLTAITREQPDYDEIEKIVAMDVSLTFSLLKMVNSAYFALPNRVKNVKQALTILGLGQLRRWIYLMSYVPEGGMTEELVRISFLRATFCQSVSEEIKTVSLSAESAYLFGMFSVLGILLEVPLEDAVNQLPLTDELKEGLLGEEGPYHDLLQLCIAYEKGKWSEVQRYAQALGVPEKEMAQHYLLAVEHVNQVWSEVRTGLRES